jgi:hypothetical protein
MGLSIPTLPTIVLVAAGTIADLLNAPFAFDSSRHPEIRITLAP